MPYTYTQPIILFRVNNNTNNCEVSDLLSLLLKTVLDDYFFPSEDFFAISKIVPLSTKSLYSLWQCVNQCKEKKDEKSEQSG